MDAATVRSLTTPAARSLLAELASLPPSELDGAPGLALASRLRRSHDPGLVAAATTLVVLRQRARTKLGDDAPHLLLDRTGLEQATRSTVASHRAARLAASDVSTVADLGCGVGADLLALARAGLSVTGVDRDPARVEMARANLAALSLPGQVVEADVHHVDLSGYDAVFVDPARRGGAGRSFDPAAWSPPWAFVQSLLAEDPVRYAVVKAAPGLPHAMVPPRVEAEWVSDGGDLVEACLWGRQLATATRRVTVLPAGATLTDANAPAEQVVGPVGGWLYEPVDAVGRAGLVTAVAHQVQGRLVDPHLAYVSSDRLVDTPFATAYEVLAELPYRERPLRAALRSRGVGTLTIKRRGVDVVPEALRRRLALRGDAEATIVLTRVAGAGRALLVERVR